MTSSPSIARRALLAIVLMVGFYLLALAISISLLYVPYAETAYANRLHFIQSGSTSGADGKGGGRLDRLPCSATSSRTY